MTGAGTLVATALVLASAALHAAWNAVLKKQDEPRVGAVVILAVAALAASVAAFVPSRAAFPSAAALAWTLASGLGEAAYFVALARAVADAPLGAAYTVSRGGSIVAVWPASMVWLGERAHPAAMLGATVILAGIVLTGIERSSRAGRSGRGLAWAAASAVFVAAVYLAYKRALGAGAEPNALFATSLCVAVPFNVAALGRGAVARIAGAIGARPLVLVSAGVACTVSFLMFLSALAESGAGRVLTLRNTSVVFAHALAWLGGERPTRAQMVGAALVVAGAAVLGTS